MSQAGSEIRYIQNAATQELTNFARGQAPGPEVSLVTRVKYNPNLYESRFSAVTELISNITMLALFLTGAAVIRELEHGTIEHLLVMPLRPVEIMLAKVWATALVVARAATISLLVVVRWVLDVPTNGSVPLFVFGELIYLFAVTSLGILLATLARSMPQFALLGMSVYLVMALLSGGTTPLDSMPESLQKAVQFSPTTHFVSFAQAILFRGAGLDVVWRDFAAVAAIGVVPVYPGAGAVPPDSHGGWVLIEVDRSTAAAGPGPVYHRPRIEASLNPALGFGRYFRLCGSCSICRGRCSRARSRERTHTTEMTDDLATSTRA